jgi:hypothetical protein
MCGHGVSADETPNMANACMIHHHQDARLIQADICKTTCGMMGHHKELVKIVQASSMDPKRAKQDTEDTRDTIFFKLDAYINLQGMRHVTWKTYEDIPKHDLFNMDKVGNDTMKQHSKMIADKVAIMARMFLILMPEAGDIKMNINVTAYISTPVPMVAMKMKKTKPTIRHVSHSSSTSTCTA